MILNGITIATIVAALIALILFLRFETKSITVTNYKINLDLGIEKPVRILQVSDLQSRYFGKNQNKLILKCKEERPDAIVISGDLIDRNFTDYRAAACAVKGLAEIAPLFYVDGNHETALNPDEYREFLESESGLMDVLFNRCTDFECRGVTFHMCGLCEDTINKSRGYDRDCRDYDEAVIIDVLGELARDCFDGPKLLLAHEPQIIDIYAKGGFDIVYSGHAHGGQFRIPFTGQGLYAPEQGALPKYTQGLHKCGSGLMVISRGLGNSTFPFRLFNRPELVVTDIV